MNDGSVPRTHALALEAALQAMEGDPAPPDAVVLGCTTGGMLTTEELLKKGVRDASRFRWHGTGTVATYIARKIGCLGPSFTISTACSSGALALKTAFELIRSGQAKRVLAGGADGLCHLTYYGFCMLQLIDPQGARPFDQDRAGMTVGEAAAMLMLVAAESPPPGARAELLGGGISCDAYHPSAPHPHGEGALAAMRDALEEAEMGAAEIDYINLHGTGTQDGDASEAKAIRRLFGEEGPPASSSSKDSFSHSLAASGAVEAVISTLSLQHGLLPATPRCKRPDPELSLGPVPSPKPADLKVVLSNSFGFGGNNASLMFGQVDHKPASFARISHPSFSGTPDRFANQGAALKSSGGVVRNVEHRLRCCDAELQNEVVDPGSAPSAVRQKWLAVLGSACLTGVGHMEISTERFKQGLSLAGRCPSEELTRVLSPRALRRQKRLSRIALALAKQAHAEAGNDSSFGSVFVGTGFGSLSETYDFLQALFESNQEFSSPTDFVGSVHNAVAGQLAIRYQAHGPNITTTGEDDAFEQAVFLASLLAPKDGTSCLILGADEAHEKMTPLVDPNSPVPGELADGGGALVVRPTEDPFGIALAPRFFKMADDHPRLLESLVKSLGGRDAVCSQIGAVLVGIPASQRSRAKEQLRRFVSDTGFSGPVIDYRRQTGEFATAAAVAAVLAVRLLHEGVIPAHFTPDGEFQLAGKRILLLGLGSRVTAIEVVG
jgi:3-oxoacyl-[acyl-carrier-protein] synthase-1/3-oxoacyl-[acyl-carrier-protein] synthase II